MIGVATPVEGAGGLDRCWSSASQFSRRLLAVYLGALRPRRARGDPAAWRSSLFAGFMGALASQLWFIAFALTDAARVRTLALVEVLFAQVVSLKLFREPPSLREWPRHDAHRRRGGDADRWVTGG